jgi:hypothetical protein
MSMRSHAPRVPAVAEPFDPYKDDHRPLCPLCGAERVIWKLPSGRALGATCVQEVIDSLRGTALGRDVTWPARRVTT